MILRQILVLTALTATVAAAKPAEVPLSLKLPIKAARPLVGNPRGALAVGGKEDRKILAYVDLAPLKRLGNRADVEAAILHWRIVTVPPTQLHPLIAFYRVKSAKLPAKPVAAKDFEKLPLLSGRLDLMMEGAGKLRASGFSVALKNWASGKWPNRGMVVAMRSPAGPTPAMVLADPGGATGPYLEVKLTPKH